MKRRKRGLSAGTILALALTAAVVFTCVFLYVKVRSADTNVAMSVLRAAAQIGDAARQPDETVKPEATVHTVTVTMAPAAAPTVALATLPPARPVGEKRTFTITAGGLMAFESDISDTVYDQTSKTFDYTPVFSLLRAKADGDLTLVALPQVISADQKYGDEQIPDAAADGVRASGFEYILLNSSHILDQGSSGAEQTVQSLRNRGLHCLGVTAEDGAQHQVILLNGVRIALLSYTESLTAKGKLTLENQPGLMQLYTQQQAERDIASVRAQGADVVIVSIHWGKADTTSPTNAMRHTAQALAEAGADVILGIRPRRVLPLETISVSDDNGIQRQCLIAYSLGTLLAESRDGYDISGMLLNLTITCDGSSMRFDSVAFTPTYIWRQNVNGKLQYRVVCSSDPAPEAMDAKQRDVMERALKRIQTILKDSPVTQRQ